MENTAKNYLLKLLSLSQWREKREDSCDITYCILFIYYLVFFSFHFKWQKRRVAERTRENGGQRRSDKPVSEECHPQIS
jgi:hypothetical protein